MYKTILAFVLSLNTKTFALCRVYLVWGFCKKNGFSHIKTLKNGCQENQGVSCDQPLDKLSKKLSSKLLVQEEHCFKKGPQCAPWTQELQTSLAWRGLSQTSVQSWRKWSKFSTDALQSTGSKYLTTVFSSLINYANRQSKSVSIG